MIQRWGNLWQRLVIDIALSLLVWKASDLSFPVAVFFAMLQISIPALGGIYRYSWGYMNLYHIAMLAGSAVLPLIGSLLFLPLFFFNALVLSSIALLALLLHRFVVYFILNPEMRRKKSGETPIIIYGAGTVAMHLLHDLSRSDQTNRYEIAAILDNDPGKIHTRLGAYIIRSGKEISEIAARRKVQEVWFTMPLTAPVFNSVLDQMQDSPVRYKVVPRKITQLIPDIRAVKIEDLIQRPEIRLNPAPVAELLAGKRVLITGAAGSIGREIARQVWKHAPSRLVLADQWEQGVYELENEFAEHNSVFVTIADVRDPLRMQRLMLSEKPEFIFHAAAYKHVPLMEVNFEESVKTNILGLWNILQAVDLLISRQKNLSVKFVNISTDKAVSPENIMGLSKRISELVIYNFSRKFQDTGNFTSASVRFGNVLGSSGSVVPLFWKQIQEGGPLTVTHPEMERFFMTIPEAVNLVLHAIVISRGNDILALDMGKPIRIVELAERLVVLSGHTPYKDIDIVFTGIRPGEKLKEELFWTKGSVQTSLPFVFRSEEDLKTLDSEEVVSLIREAISEEHSLDWWKRFLGARA